jgi:hypothetical protein
MVFSRRQAVFVLAVATVVGGWSASFADEPAKPNIEVMDELVGLAFSEIFADMPNKENLSRAITLLPAGSDEHYSFISNGGRPWGCRTRRG